MEGGGGCYVALARAQERRASRWRERGDQRGAATMVPRLVAKQIGKMSIRSFSNYIHPTAMYFRSSSTPTPRPPAMFKKTLHMWQAVVPPGTHSHQGDITGLYYRLFA